MSMSAPKLNLAGSIASAATAACLAALFTNPFEVIKTRLQLDGEGKPRAASTRQYSGIVHGLRTIWRLEGLRGVQAGLSAALLYQVALNGSRLGLYEHVQRTFVAATGADPFSTPMKMLCGASAGAIGATLGSPLYLIKCRLQAQSPHFQVAETHRYSGLVDGLRTEFRAGGVRALFRGIDGALPRVMTGSAVQLASYDRFKAMAAESGVPAGLAQYAAASCAASLLTVTAMNPLDVISTRLYQSAGKATIYSGPWDCAVKTVRAEGVGALQKGWLAQYARLGPHTILTFIFLESLRPVFTGVAAFVA
jgi:solute carrier family 25 protein 34/35